MPLCILGMIFQFDYAMIVALTGRHCYLCDVTREGESMKKSLLRLVALSLAVFMGFGAVAACNGDETDEIRRHGRYRRSG